MVELEAVARGEFQILAQRSLDQTDPEIPAARGALSSSGLLAIPPNVFTH
jgi:hypothetical protein